MKNIQKTILSVLFFLASTCTTISLYSANPKKHAEPSKEKCQSSIDAMLRTNKYRTLLPSEMRILEQCKATHTKTPQPSLGLQGMQASLRMQTEQIEQAMQATPRMQTEETMQAQQEQRELLAEQVRQAEEHLLLEIKKQLQ